MMNFVSLFRLGILYSRLISGLGSLLFLTAEAGFHYRYILFQSLFPVINEELIYSVVIKSVPFMSMLGAHVHYGFSSTPPEKAHSICGLQPNMLNRDEYTSFSNVFCKSSFWWGKTPNNSPMVIREWLEIAAVKNTIFYVFRFCKHVGFYSRREKRMLISRNEVYFLLHAIAVDVKQSEFWWYSCSLFWSIKF